MARVGGRMERAAAGRLAAQIAVAGLTLAIAALFAAEALHGLDPAEVARQAAGHGPAVLLAVAAAAAASWAAVAGYDAAALPLAGQRLPARRALGVGLAASGLGQALGFGLLVGGFVRWRMLRREGLSAAAAAKVSGLVALGFFAGLGAVALAAAAVSAEAAARLGAFAPAIGPAGAALAAAAAFGLLALAGRRVGSARRALAFVALAAADVLPAAFALWMLLPEGVPFGAVLAAYLAALFAGLLANTPGGAGAFEGVILLALPEVPLESALAAILVFRVFFHGLPLIAGLGLLARAELAGARQAAAAAAPRTGAAMARSARAESALLHLPEATALAAADGAAFLIVGARGAGLVALGDPVGPPSRWPALIGGLRRRALGRGRAAMIYRAGPRAAALGRAAGFAAVKIGAEAMLDPAAFDLGSASRRRLRRKVRQAEGAGLTVHRDAPGAAPLARLRPVSDAWLAEKGGRERGFTVGRFEADWLRRFPILEARDGAGRTVAFLSLWRSGDGAEWSIDLMRAGPEAPSGAMALLIVAAIGDAKAAGARRFSLCMAPLAGLERAEGPAARLLRRLREREEPGRELRGLEEFKASFAPRWRPCYALLPKGPGAIPALLALRSLMAGPHAR